MPKGLWNSFENELPWQCKYAAKLGDVHRNKLEISLGTLRINLSKSYNLKGSVIAVEILIDPVLLNKRKKPTSFASFSTFPPAIKDLSLVVSKKEPAENIRIKVEEIVQSVISNDITMDPINLFDVFSGKGLSEDKKSIACSLRMRAPDRTLGEKEVNHAFEKIRLGIENETDYELRK